MNLISHYLEQNNMTKYQLSKKSRLPYSTICDICNEKTPLNRCSADTIYKLSLATGISCDNMIAAACEKKESFDLFKSNVCHEVKRKGEVGFMIEILESGVIRDYFVQVRQKESLYLLGMLDYLSRKNEVPICSDYDDLRHYRFAEPIYPSGLLVRAEITQDESVKEEAIRNAIPEFMRFNIVENEIENVC